MTRAAHVVGAVLAVALVAPSCAGGESSTIGEGGTAPATTPASTTVAPESTPTTEPPPTTAEPRPPLVVDGVVSDAALDAVLTPDGQVDQSVLAAFGEEFQALPVDEQQAVLADLSLRTELELAKISGLEAAVGDAASTAAALTAASAQVSEQADSAIAAASASADEPQGLRHGYAGAAAPQGTEAGGVTGVGLFLGYVALGAAAKVATEASNDFDAGATDVSDSDGSVSGASVDEVDLEVSFKGNQSGLDVDSSIAAAIHPCPGPDGTFDIDALIEIKASKGGTGREGLTGQNVRMELKITGTVGDDAQLVDKNVVNNVQWADFAGGKGQFIDVTYSGPSGIETVVANRGAGTVTDSFVQLASLLGELTGLALAAKLVEVAEQAWKSGRCVKLTITPSAGPTGLTPNEVVSVLAEPRSKVDGGRTGGKVTATLTDGGATVDPAGAAQTADATVAYTAPDEPGKSGTVEFESRSRRGVGRVSVTFDTAKPASFQIVGGAGDLQVDNAVCDITQPFTLTGGGFTVEFSGGSAGTYSFTGPFNAKGEGTYTIDLPGGPDEPGTMTGTATGSVTTPLGEFTASGGESYTLTPITC